MAKKKMEIFHSMAEENYRLMWHISALSDNRYRIAILSDKRGLIDEVAYRGGFYEQCLTMNQEISPGGEKLYLEIENESDNMDLFDDDRIDSGGLGESLCIFCRGGSAQNYHEANILLWAVKEDVNELKCVGTLEKADELECAGTTVGSGSSFSFPLRNMSGQSCLSYFMCGHTTDKISVKIKNKEKAYVDITCQCTDQIAHLMMGSVLTLKEGLQLEIAAEGSSNIQMVCDCSVAQGGSLKLVHYHVKSYDTAVNKLPFSLDVLGWTAI